MANGYAEKLLHFSIKLPMTLAVGQYELSRSY